MSVDHVHDPPHPPVSDSMPSSSASLRVVRGADRLGPASGTSVGELVALARDGDAIAFRLLVERYYARMLRLAGNMGLGTEDAEEAVQDALVRAHGALGRFEPSAPFEPWLFRILANCCRSSHARGRWWRRLRADAPLDRAPARDTSVDTEWREAIDRALGTLPRDQRDTLLLRHAEG